MKLTPCHLAEGHSISLSIDNAPESVKLNKEGHQVRELSHQNVSGGDGILEVKDVRRRATAGSVTKFIFELNIFKESRQSVGIGPTNGAGSVSLSGPYKISCIDIEIHAHIIPNDVFTLLGG